MKPLVPLLLALGLGACATGERGLESAHQPVVVDNIAYVPGCPDWADTTGGERESQSSNYGCATNGNLAAMIADPRDLLHGRSDPATAELATRAIRAWREVAPTSKQWSVSVVSAGATGGK